MLTTLAALSLAGAVAAEPAATGPAPAELAPACAPQAAMDRLLSFEDIYFGEVHGTNEVPAFLLCFLDTLSTETHEPIVVSLELPGEALDPASSFWNDAKQADGRSSRAMFQLLRELAHRQEAGLLSLHFQRPRQHPEEVGTALRNLAPNRRVIALAGNIHSSRARWVGLPVTETAGMFAGEHFTHVMLASAHGGKVWACLANCGVHSVAAEPEADTLRGTLVDGVEVGHDYIFFLAVDGFTASPPASMGK